MTDIVERLQKFTSQSEMDADEDPDEMMRVAAAEIKRLRRDVQNLNSDCIALAGGKAELRAENERLQELLHKPTIDRLRSEDERMRKLYGVTE